MKVYEVSPDPQLLLDPSRQVHVLDRYIVFHGTDVADQGLEWLGFKGSCCLRHTIEELRRGEAIIADVDDLHRAKEALAAGPCGPQMGRAIEALERAWAQRGLPHADALLDGLEAIAREGGPRRDRLRGLLADLVAPMPAGSVA